MTPEPAKTQTKAIVNPIDSTGDKSYSVQAQYIITQSNTNATLYTANANDLKVFNETIRGDL